MPKRKRVDSKLKRSRIITLSFCVILSIFCLIVLIYPYLIISEYEVQKISFWGDPTQKAGVIFFTIKSEGLLTANYPIDVEVKIGTIENQTSTHVYEDFEKYFRKGNELNLLIHNSYQYPIMQDPEKRFTSAGSIPISIENRSGKGTIIFPHEGIFSDYYILVNYEPVWSTLLLEDKPPIFVIESYGARMQMVYTIQGICITVIIASIVCIRSILKKD